MSEYISYWYMVDGEINPIEYEHDWDYNFYDERDVRSLLWLMAREYTYGWRETQPVTLDITLLSGDLGEELYKARIEFEEGRDDPKIRSLERLEEGFRKMRLDRMFLKSEAEA